MSLSDLASLGSFVSGIAILVSLVYVAMQLRQAAKHQRALMNQGVITRTIEILMVGMQPPVSDVIARASIEGEKLSAQDIWSLAQGIRAHLLNAQDSYVQHQAGLVDDITLDHNLAAIRGLLANPVYRALWLIQRSFFAPDWAAYVDKIVKETPVGGTADIVAVFEAVLAQVQA